MGPTDGEYQSKAQGKLSKTKQLRDISGIRSLSDMERPASLGVLQLAIAGMNAKLQTFQYSSKNLANLVAALQELHKSLMLRKLYVVAGSVVPLIQEAQAIEQGGYTHPI